MISILEHVYIYTEVGNKQCTLKQLSSENLLSLQQLLGNNASQKAITTDQTVQLYCLISKDFPKTDVHRLKCHL